MLRLHLASLFFCWLGFTARAEPPPGIPIIDCHVHLWDIARPEGLGWIKKDDKVLNRSFLPKEHEPVATANGVGGMSGRAEPA
jgi:hypothetical protein